MKYVGVFVNIEPEEQRKVQQIQEEGWETMKEKNEEIKVMKHE